MIRLVSAELTRLRSRRFAVLTAILVLAAVLAFQLLVNSELSPPSAAERAAGQAQFEENHRDWEQHHADYEQQCRASEPAGADCTYAEPTPGDFVYTASFDEVAGISVSVATYLTALAVFMVAGSFIGAEFTSGSISNWLTFIPQRGRVFAAKLIAVVVFGAALSLLAAALALLGPVVLAGIHDVPTTGVDKLAGAGGRGILIAIALGTLGFCIGLVARHTAAAIGVLLGYLFIWFVRSIFLAENVTAQRLTPWTPEANIAAIVEKPHAYNIPVREITSDGVGFSYLRRTSPWTTD